MYSSPKNDAITTTYVSVTSGDFTLLKKDVVKLT